LSKLSGWKAGTELLLEMGRITRGNLTRDEALKRITQLLIESFPIHAVSIMLYDSSLRSVHVSASVARSDDALIVSPDITLKVNPDSVIWEAICNPHAPLILEKGVFDSVLGLVANRWSAVVPMKSGEEVTGVMILAKKDSVPALGADREILMSVASQAALIASKASLMESLRQAEERYHMLMENAGDMVFVLDGGGRFLYVNSRCKDLLGYEPQELLGKYFGEFVSPESWARTVSAVKAAASKKEKYVEYSWLITRKDGTIATLDVRGSLFYHGYEVSRHQGIARDTSRESRLEEELKKRGQELDKSKSREETMREYLSVANIAQEEERARIARELHDGAIQYLVALRRRFDLFKREYVGKGRAPGQERSSNNLLDEIDLLLDRVTSDLREFARNLRPPVLDDFGLISACEWLADQAEKEGIRVDFSVKGELGRLPRDVEASVFRIAQEALANSVKHSGASLIEFSLIFKDAWLEVTVKDNGKGFEPPKSPGSLVRAGQMGLVGMYERAELLGASLNLESGRGQGTTLTLLVPLRATS